MLFVCIVFCPSDFTYYDNQGTCLKLVRQTVNWMQANALCYTESMRAHLVVISDVQKQLNFKDFIEGEDKTSCRGLF